MRSAPRRPRGGQIASALIGMLVVAVVAGVLVAVAVTPAIALTGTAAKGGLSAFDELPSDLKIGALDQKTQVYAKDGDKQVRIASFYAQDRDVVGWDDVSSVVKNAAVAGEDVRFYEHGGVDPVGIVRATLGNLAGEDLQGASTITQQYVKNVCVQEAENEPTTSAIDAAYQVCTDPTVGRKLREARLAIALEKQYSKDQILLGYLNIAGFGGRVYGIEAAAHVYFDTTARKLTVAQAASLIAIVNDPQKLRLDEKANLAANTTRRNYILGVELRHRLITEQQYDEAIATTVKPRITPSESGCTSAGVAGFFCDYVKRTVLTDPAFGKDPATRAANLQRGGYKIYTTLDLGLEKKAKQAVSDSVPATSPVFQVGGAAVSVEVGTGRILTMATNKTFDDSAHHAAGATAVNYAGDLALGASGGFQPGSTFKLFTLLDWLKTGHTLNQVVDANAGVKPASSFTACGKPYEGEDWNLGNDEPGEGGAMSVMAATAQSVNGAFASMAQQLDLCDIQDLAEDFGVRPANGDTDPAMYLPFVVGGSYGVSPVSMAAAYAAIANNGTYCSPVVLDRVVSADGSRLPVPKSTCKQVVDPQVAIAAAYALRGVLQSGTAGGDNTPDGVYEFGKTGTTDDAVQTWMIGTSSKVTTAVWVGNVKGRQFLRQTVLPHPCYVSGSGRAADARHCVWRAVQTAVNAKYGGATSWAQPEPQYLYGGVPEVQQQQDQADGTVPDVSGMSKDAAAQALVAAGYAWAYGDDVASDQPAGTVASTDPAAGTPTPAHTQIVIHGSAGP